MRRHLKQMVLLCLLLTIVVVLEISGANTYLTLENLKRYQYNIEQIVVHHYVLSVLFYISLYIASTALAIPGGLVLSLAGGLFFHTWPGVIYVNIGATVGAILAFFFARYILGDWVQKRYSMQLQSFNDEFANNGHIYLLSVRLIPVFPFFLINLLSGLTRVRLKTFVWTTSLGILPASLIYTFAGSRVGNVTSPRDILSRPMLSALILLAMLVLVPVLWTKLKPRRQQ
jgi:uncharacterized membrane protein YdjX (TVP38/TMEM64 family)